MLTDMFVKAQKRNRMEAYYGPQIQTGWLAREQRQEHDASSSPKQHACADKSAAAGAKAAA